MNPTTINFQEPVNSSDTRVIFSKMNQLFVDQCSRVLKSFCPIPIPVNIIHHFLTLSWQIHRRGSSKGRTDIAWLITTLLFDRARSVAGIFADVSVIWPPAVFIRWSIYKKNLFPSDGEAYISHCSMFIMTDLQVCNHRAVFRIFNSGANWPPLLSRGGQ